MNWRRLQGGMAEAVSTPSKDIRTSSPSQRTPTKRLLQNTLGILYHVRLVASPCIALFWFFSSSASDSRAGVVGMCGVEWQCQR